MYVLLFQVDKLGSEKTVLQRERSELQRQVADLGGAVDKLNKEKVRRTARCLLPAGVCLLPGKWSPSCWHMFTFHWDESHA
jgi:hypothetical protein